MWRKAKPPTNRRHELLLELFYNINAGDKGWLEEEDLQRFNYRLEQFLWFLLGFTPVPPLVSLILVSALAADLLHVHAQPL